MKDKQLGFWVTSQEQALAIGRMPVGSSLADHLRKLAMAQPIRRGSANETAVAHWIQREAIAEANKRLRVAARYGRRSKRRALFNLPLLLTELGCIRAFIESVKCNTQ